VHPTYQHRVLYGDTDQMGVVYYANYLRFFEGARNDWIRRNGIPYAEIERRGLLLPVLEAAVQYLRPAKYDDLVEIELKVAHTLVKVRFDYVARRSGETSPLCLGHTVHAWVDKEGRVARAPAWLLETLEPASTRRRTLDLEPRTAGAARTVAPGRD
jgi:acyl-CoA thioester hydrolase